MAYIYLNGAPHLSSQDNHQRLLLPTKTIYIYICRGSGSSFQVVVITSLLPTLRFSRSIINQNFHIPHITMLPEYQCISPSPHQLLVWSRVSYISCKGVPYTNIWRHEWGEPSYWWCSPTKPKCGRIYIYSIHLAAPWFVIMGNRMDSRGFGEIPSLHILKDVFGMSKWWFTLDIFIMTIRKHGTEGREGWLCKGERRSELDQEEPNYHILWAMLLLRPWTSSEI